MMQTNLPPGLLQYLFIPVTEHIFPKSEMNHKHCKVIIGGLISTRMELFAFLSSEWVGQFNSWNKNNNRISSIDQNDVHTLPTVKF